MENQTPITEGQKTTISVEVPSADNIANRRPLVPASFALAIIFFFLSFCEFTCGNRKITSIKGIDMVTGTEISVAGQGSEDFPPNPWAIVAFASAAIGLGVYLIREKREALIGTGAGAIGFGSLLILQYAITTAMEEKSEGMVEASFQFGYWGALTAMLVGGLISYLRLRKTTNVVINYTPQANAATTSQPSYVQQPVQIKVDTQPLVDAGKQLAESGKHIGAGISSLGSRVLTKRNIVIASILLTITGVGYGVYYFFLENPGRDAKNAKLLFCNCQNSEQKESLEALKNFNTTFNTKGFKTRSAAREAYSQVFSEGNSKFDKCYDEATATYQKLRTRHETKTDKLNLFDQNYELTNCPEDLSNEQQSLNEVIEKKILAIKDPEPDINKIKNDLLGKSYSWWNFEFLSDFTDLQITNSTKGNNRIECRVNMRLQRDGVNPVTVSAMIVYEDDNYMGWQFQSIKCSELKVTYTAPYGSWYQFAIVPSQKMNFNSSNRYWIQGENSWTAQKAGWDTDGAAITYAKRYHIQSREDFPVEVDVTYLNPNN